MHSPEAIEALVDASRQRLAAAWESAWRQQIEPALAEMGPAIGDWVAAQVLRGGRVITEQWNHAARRLRSAESAGEWRVILSEVASGFAQQAAVFDTEEEFVAAAPAMQTVVETRDTVVTVRCAAELSGDAIARLGEGPAARCYLFPVLRAGRVMAIIYAGEGPEGVDTNALELLAHIAGATIPAPPPSTTTPSLVPIAAATGNGRASALPPGEEAVHLAAQRFARVLVAEMRLHDASAVETGRRERNLYRVFREKIDKGREDFRRLYLADCPSMTDYLHQELIRNLANDNADCMGPEYPGRLA